MSRWSIALGSQCHVLDRLLCDLCRMYKRDGLTGGHVIMLGASDVNQNAALEALREYPNGLQVGGATCSLGRLNRTESTDLSL